MEGNVILMIVYSNQKLNFYQISIFVFLEGNFSISPYPQKEKCLEKYAPEGW